MKNKFLYTFVIFSFGYIANDIVENLIKPAYAYCDCSENDFNFDSSDISDFQSAVEDIVNDKISSYDYDFKRATQSIVEDCSVDSDGDISC